MYKRTVEPLQAVPNLRFIGSARLAEPAREHAVAACTIDKRVHAQGVCGGLPVR